ncbi:MAG: M24 family metallopeptidase, partial [Opitutales bacterium]|nr:M24 family metallopeptidase [Opitutales bacterium]
MREACRIAAEVLDRTCKFVEEGVTTYDIDQFAKRTMAEL